MYHCRVRFYYLGRSKHIYECIKEIRPLEHFQHEFSASAQLDERRAAEADVIFAEFGRENGWETVRQVCALAKEGADLILLAEGDKETLFAGGDLSKITEVWTLPMSDSEIRFRFLQWQKYSKIRKDFWQTQNYLDSTINCVPHLIWYKDKNGVHEKVNVSFCNAVNKTMEQIEGRAITISGT